MNPLESTYAPEAHGIGKSAAARPEDPRTRALAFALALASVFTATSLTCYALGLRGAPGRPGMFLVEGIFALANSMGPIPALVATFFLLGSSAVALFTNAGVLSFAMRIVESLTAGFLISVLMGVLGHADGGSVGLLLGSRLGAVMTVPIAALLCAVASALAIWLLLEGNARQALAAPRGASSFERLLGRRSTPREKRPWSMPGPTLAGAAVHGGGAGASGAREVAVEAPFEGTSPIPVGNPVAFAGVPSVDEEASRGTADGGVAVLDQPPADPDVRLRPRRRLEAKRPAEEESRALVHGETSLEGDVRGPVDQLPPVDRRSLTGTEEPSTHRPESELDLPDAAGNPDADDSSSPRPPLDSVLDHRPTSDVPVDAPHLHEDADTYSPQERTPAEFEGELSEAVERPLSSDLGIAAESRRLGGDLDGDVESAQLLDGGSNRSGGELEALYGIEIGTEPTEDPFAVFDIPRDESDLSGRNERREGGPGALESTAGSQGEQVSPCGKQSADATSEAEIPRVEAPFDVESKVVAIPVPPVVDGGDPWDLPRTIGLPLGDGPATAALDNAPARAASPDRIPDPPAFFVREETTAELTAADGHTAEAFIAGVVVPAVSDAASPRPEASERAMDGVPFAAEVPAASTTPADVKDPSALTLTAAEKPSAAARGRKVPRRDAEANQLPLFEGRSPGEELLPDLVKEYDAANEEAPAPERPARRPRSSRNAVTAAEAAHPTFDDLLAASGEGPTAAGPSEPALLERAIRMVLGEGRASISFLQRKLEIPFGDAQHLMAALEAEGIVGPYRGNPARDILLSLSEWEARRSP